jgi:hypothetical protein
MDDGAADLFLEKTKKLTRKTDWSSLIVSRLNVSWLIKCGKGEWDVSAWSRSILDGHAASYQQALF